MQKDKETAYKFVVKKLVKLKGQKKNQLWMWKISPNGRENISGRGFFFYFINVAMHGMYTEKKK